VVRAPLTEAAAPGGSCVFPSCSHLREPSQRKPRTFSGIEEALRNTARLYRKSLWDDVNA